MTKLQEKFKAKLEGAQFRYLNELLYTKPSAEAHAIMQKQPELFERYHSGYRQQVAYWPENPLDIMIGEVQ